MKRRVPRLTTDEQAEAFLDSDLSELDFSQFKSGRLQFEEASGSARKTRFTSGAPNPQSGVYEQLEPRAPKRVNVRRRAAEIEGPLPSEAYRLFEQAMTERKQIVCIYNGRRREVCPVILGHSQGEEKALTFQFGGESRSGLPRRGEWRCLFLADVINVQLREGPWQSGDSHTQPSHCVEVVDLDVNPDSPYKPKRLLNTPPGRGRDRGSREEKKGGPARPSGRKKATPKTLDGSSGFAGLLSAGLRRWAADGT